MIGGISSKTCYTKLNIDFPYIRSHSLRRDTYIDDVNLSKDTSRTHLLNNEGINNDDEDISIPLTTL